jgi:hypothetical protein
MGAVFGASVSMAGSSVDYPKISLCFHRMTILLPANPGKWDNIVPLRNSFPNYLGQKTKALSLRE